MPPTKHQLRLLRNYLVWRKAGCVFVHVPKTAGTSVSHALYGRPLGHYSADQIWSAFPGLMTKSVSFAVSRDPYARLISAYEFAKAGRTQHMGVVNPAQYGSSVFATFESFVMDWLAVKQLDTVDGIFRPQADYVCKGDRVAVDLVLRSETLASEISEVEELIGRRLTLPHMNATAKADHSRDYHSDQAVVRKVREIYACDYELFGYSGGRP